jgi:hypothetical protein
MNCLAEEQGAMVDAVVEGAAGHQPVGKGHKELAGVAVEVDRLAAR